MSDSGESLNEPTTVGASGAESYSIQDVIAPLWGLKWHFVSGFLLSFVIVGCELRSAAHEYEVSYSIKPGESALGNNNPSLPFADMLPGGFDFGVGPTSASLDEYRLLATSLPVAALLEQEPDLMQTIFPGEWDAETQTWRYRDLSALQTVRRLVRQAFGLPYWAKPDARRLRGFLKEELSFAPTLAGFDERRVSLNSAEPEFAVKLLERLHFHVITLANGERKRHLTQVSERISGELENSDMRIFERQAMLSLYQTVTRELLISYDIEASVLYELVEPPHASIMPVAPSLVRYAIVALVLGLVLGSVFAVSWQLGKEGLVLWRRRSG